MGTLYSRGESTPFMPTSIAGNRDEDIHATGVPGNGH